MKKAKKLLPIFLVLLLVVSGSVIAMAALGDGSVEINSTNFPDATFREAVRLYYDDDKDGFLSESERAYSRMSVSGIVENLASETGVDESTLVINDLTGIEYFSSLNTLRCNSVGNIETLDVSELKELTTLSCSDIGLEELDVSSNQKLTELYVCLDDITSLDLSENTNLVKLHCYSNSNLTSLNVSGLTKLEELRCDVCALDELDLSDNTALRFLICSYNRIPSLDLSNTCVTNATDENIGRQTIDAEVVYDEGLKVPLELDAYCVTGSSLALGAEAFVDNAFVTEDYAEVENGFNYLYSVGLNGASDMSVHVNTSHSHISHLAGFDFDNNNAILRCIICDGDETAVSYPEKINLRQTDNGYEAALDVNNDGIINAKDYALIVQTYR